MNFFKKHKKKIFFVTFVLFFLLTAVLYFFLNNSSTKIQEYNVSTNYSMELFVVNGQANLNNEVIVEESTPVKIGDTITTGENSKAVLIIDNGSSITLGGNTTITVKTLEKTSEAIITVIEQKSGITWSRVKKLVGIQNDYSVDTEDVVATVRGTEFITKVENETSVIVEESSVSVYFKNKQNERSNLKIDLSQGEGVKFRRDIFDEKLKNKLESLKQKLTTKEFDKNWYEFNECLKTRLDYTENIFTDNSRKIEFLRKIKNINCQNAQLEIDENTSTEDTKPNEEPKQTQSNNPVRTPQKLNKPNINISDISVTGLKLKLSSQNAQNYMFAIGTSENNTDILNWTEVDGSGNFEINNLELSYNTTYTISAIARAQGFLNSDPNFITFEIPKKPTGNIEIEFPEDDSYWTDFEVTGSYNIFDIPQGTENLTEVKIEISKNGLYWNGSDFTTEYNCFDAIENKTNDGFTYTVNGSSEPKYFGTLVVKAYLYYNNEYISDDSVEVLVYSPLY
ncbi:MAG: hypothetical protein KatS3mg085_556 [Candidatus Dojkabacteria bacterium]|nr:MAG: hypothetical protein KatS3mg085_556 [Candidatus Dojkabacteria bacterium]